MNFIRIISFTAALVTTSIWGNDALTASGEEPFWSLTLTPSDSQQVHALFDSPNGSTEATLSLRATKNDTNMQFYHTIDTHENFSVLIEEKSCQDDSVGNIWSHTFIVIIDDTIYTGCGGEIE